ncbi:hypothetical protein [Bacterioplanoides sp.]|uniref:hypothetical protein n=1 Tax=Bacterioplanoides sp. TaxID=2066072 RepID=UPI003B00A816
MKLLFVFLAFFLLLPVYAADSSYNTKEPLRNTKEPLHGAEVPLHSAQPTWVSPQAAEIYLYKTRSSLMQGSHNDHVVSLYFFGEYQNRTLIGLERVKGENYQQFFSLLVFEKKDLLGYYQYVPSFPAAVETSGRVVFPKRFRPELANKNEIFSLAKNDFPPLCFPYQSACAQWQAVLLLIKE